jgi:hypothetical protein
MIAYWFFGTSLRDGRAVPADGEWLEHVGTVKPCVSGLHASPSLYDALRYGVGSNVALVELGGTIVPHGDPIDKYAASRRRIIQRRDGIPFLDDFARWCALQVVDLIVAPEKDIAVIRRWLETGDETLREAAYASASTSASTLAYASAYAAARASARASASASASTSASTLASTLAYASAYAAARASASASAYAAQRAKCNAMAEELFR